MGIKYYEYKGLLINKNKPPGQMQGLATMVLTSDNANSKESLRMLMNPYLFPTVDGHPDSSSSNSSTFWATSHFLHLALYRFNKTDKDMSVSCV